MSRMTAGYFMKFKIILMLIILGIVSALPMIYTGKFDPVALLDLDFSPNLGMDRLGAKVSKKYSSVVTDEKVKLYKWRNADGVMQFTSDPPPSTIAAEQIELNPNSNVIPAIKISKKEVKVESKPVAKTKIANPYAAKEMKKMMDDARGVEAMLQQRNEQQQKMLDSL